MDFCKKIMHFDVYIKNYLRIMEKKRHIFTAYECTEVLLLDMPMGNKIQFTGYHRAEKNQADRIKKLGNFPISTKPDMWLGDGVYFWLNLKDAEWWNNDRYSVSTIFTAQIECQKDQYKDLDDPEEMAAMKAFIAQNFDSLHGRKKTLNTGNNVEYRALLCNYYKKRKKLMVLKFSFPIKITNEIGFEYGSTRTQICATNTSVIHKIEKVKDIIIGDENEYV